jgi:putative ABC transport system ATP-binding protein
MSASNRSILQCRQVGFAVQAPGGELHILNDISLNLNAGETLAIVGASGSGKTTLLGLLAGLEQPTTGDIWLAGAHLNQLDENERARLRRRQVGFVFQSFHLLPSLTALENVMLALEIAGVEKARPRASSALEQVGLGHRMQHYPRQMSGGEQQRVAIARAFSGQPAILFADEPTGNLDRTTGQTIADLLFQINREQQTSLVLVTHDLTLARRCSRIEQIEDGRLLDQPARARARRLQLVEGSPQP